jgi:hypothetical protein
MSETCKPEIKQMRERRRQFLAIALEHNVDSAMGDPLDAMEAAYQIGRGDLSSLRELAGLWRESSQAAGPAGVISSHPWIGRTYRLCAAELTAALDKLEGK